MAYQILFVDDSPTMQRVAEIVLAREDMRLVAATTGNAALSFAKEQQLHAAVVDVSLPGMDGYAVCQALRSESNTANIPILLLASSQEPIDQAKCDACGATGHINKPFEAQVFIDKLRQMVGLPAATPVTASKPAAAASKPIASAPTPQATAAPAAPIPVAIATPPAAQVAPSPVAAAPISASQAGGGWSMPAGQEKGQSLAPPLPPPSPRPTPQPVQEAAPPVRTTVAPPSIPSAPPVAKQPIAAPPTISTPPSLAPQAPGATNAAVAAAMAKQMPALEGITGPLDASAAAVIFREIVERVSWEVVPAMTQAYLEAHYKTK